MTCLRGRTLAHCGKRGGESGGELFRAS